MRNSANRIYLWRETVAGFDEVLSYRINHVERIAQAIIVEGEL